jgi:hypothetical protein
MIEVPQAGRVDRYQRKRVPLTVFGLAVHILILDKASSEAMGSGLVGRGVVVLPEEGNPKKSHIKKDGT